MNGHENERPRVLVTGATGYIGGRLAPRLADAGFRVRVLARSPQKLRDVPWAKDVDVVRGDLGDQGSLEDAFTGVDIVYYLVHSMGGSAEFVNAERESALNVARAAKAAGVRRIVYLGGLHPEAGELSPHLRSRAEVGEVLIGSGIQTVVLQAGVVIGSGSASFEMIRHLTNRLPVMTTPKWVHNTIQPIAVRDVLYYLIAAADAPFDESRTWDIGGPDVMQYGEMMNAYAANAGLRPRKMVVLPVLTPRLAGHWIGLVTPIPRALAMPLIESLQYDAVAHENDIDAIIPPPEEGLTSYPESVRLALACIENGSVETTWSNATSRSAPSDPLPSDPDWAGEVVFLDERSQDCDASPAALWDVVEGIGGENGWYSFPAAWVVRGWLDKIVGGVGLTRGRRDPRRLAAGDVLDWWRVEEIERGSLLRLRAEMKAPGGAWLELKVTSLDDGKRSRYDQRAIFIPRGLGGRVYWYAIMPFHGVIFRGMLENITGKAERSETPTVIPG